MLKEEVLEEKSNFYFFFQKNMITEKGIKAYCNVNEKKLSYINLGIILIIVVAIIVFLEFYLFKIVFWLFWDLFI